MATAVHLDAGPVTIDRAYFETLVRRANHEYHDTTASARQVKSNDTFVSIPRPEYESLQLVARHYANLRRNLINGGVVEETITLLSEDDTSLPTNTPSAAANTAGQQDFGTDKSSGGVRLEPHGDPSTLPVLYSSHEVASHGGGYRPNWSDNKQDWMDAAGDDYYSPSYSVEGPSIDRLQDETIPGFSEAQPVHRPQFARMCKRTVALSGLPEQATHQDITNVVRGGMLLDIYLRSYEHTALVSFLNEQDAIGFYEHTKKNDVYIGHKRISIRWAERQFHLPGHVAGKIAAGATRNLIVRRCDPRLTEQSIRDDLEHIHNLIVIKVDFVGVSCHIKTNSVHNAMFARTCMMSRVTYKGSKIEWDVDECAQPLPVVHRPSSQPQRMPRKGPAKVGVKNRFAMLRIDDSDNESDDKIDSSSEILAASTVDVSA